jgi:hypothetical protein
MACGCFGYGGDGNLQIVNGILTADGYHEILHHNLGTSSHIFHKGRFSFQQDNDPKHTAKK